MNRAQAALHPTVSDVKRWNHPWRTSWKSLRQILLTLVGLVGLSLASGNCLAQGGAQGGPQVMQQNVPIYLYGSPATAAFFEANEGDYSRLLDQWRGFLKKYGKDVREIGRADLLSPLPRGVLILGSALLLDDDERRAINHFGQRGGSILGTWATGARDGSGNWRGFGFVQDTFDVRIAGQITRDSEEWFMLPMGDGPLTWPIPSGRRMYLGKIAENLLRVQASHIAARYSTWDRSLDPAAVNGAIAYAEKQGSRRIYFGFAESAMDFHLREDTYDMLDAMISWLRREPRVFKAAWPGGRVAAQIIEMDVDGAYQSSSTLARQLEESELPGSFYVISSQSIKAPDYLRSLVRRGHEIAYQADVPGGFKDQAPEIQETRMLDMFDQMRKVLGPNPALLAGFRAPGESYDKSTEVLLRRYGVRYHLADSSATEDRLPFFSRSEKSVTGTEALIVLPRTSLRDETYRAEGMNNERASNYLMREFETAVEMGALSVFSVQSQAYATESPVNLALPQFFRRLAALRNKVWTGRADEVAAWWRNRERVAIRTQSDSRGVMLELTVQAPGVPPGLTMMTTHSDAGRMPLQAEAMTPYTPLAEIKAVDEFRSAIVLGRLPAGTHQYRIRY